VHDLLVKGGKRGLEKTSKKVLETTEAGRGVFAGELFLKGASGGRRGAAPSDV